MKLFKLFSYHTIGDKVKVEKIDDGYKLFVHNVYFNNIDWDDKESVIDRIKEIIVLIKKRYNLKIKGLYRVKVYPSKVGVLLYVLLLDEDNYSNLDLELRIVIIFNKDIYLKVDDSSFLIDNSLPYIYKDSYYINIDDIDIIDKYIEYGSIVLEDE